MLRKVYLQTIGEGYEPVAVDDGIGWLVGPECPPKTCRFLVGINHYPKVPLAPVEAPAFMESSGQVYGKIGGGWGAGTQAVRKANRTQLDDPDLDQLIAFSAALPEWAYLYLAPRKERNAVPLILNRGEVHFFSPIDPEEVAHIEQMLTEIHAQFIAVVRQGRGERLINNPGVFSGLVWTGERALGLVDGFGDCRYMAKELLGVDSLVDHTPRPNVLDRLTRGVGIGLFEGLGAWVRLEGVWR